MIDFIIGLICLILAQLIIQVRKAYFALPLNEVRRRAIKGDKFYQTIYPVVSYSPTLRILLWIKLALLSSIALVLFARIAPIWLGVVLVLGWLALAFSWLPNSKISKSSIYITEFVTPFFAWFLNWSYPLVKELDRLANIYPNAHTGLYELEDLHQVLSRQSAQADNRISELQLGRARKLLSFENATADQYLKSWKSVMKVADSDLIGPKLLDELHKSGQIAFPVTKGSNQKQAIGVLYKDDIGINSQGKVSDYMHSPIKTVSEHEKIESVLAKFSLSGQNLFMVVNKAHDIVGVLSLKDALSSLLSPALSAHANNNKLTKKIDSLEEEESDSGEIDENSK